jgi:hypothetical protein
VFAGVAFPPVAGNGIAGAGEPFFIAPELFQRFRGKNFCAYAGRMAERFEESRRGDLVVDGRYQRGWTDLALNAGVGLN